MQVTTGFAKTNRKFTEHAADGQNKAKRYNISRDRMEYGAMSQQRPRPHWKPVCNAAEIAPITVTMGVADPVMAWTNGSISTTKRPAQHDERGH
jgi:hypothetical protein